ncbi:MAG: hypothetical protein U1F87_15405 [Kiritimatiellia bacterium]
MPAGDTATRAYRVRIPRVTAGTNLTFGAEADGSAANILLKLDGGMDLEFAPGPRTARPATCATSPRG